MDKMHYDNDLLKGYWDTLQNNYYLSEKQLKLFQTYLKLLLEWNNKFNLTAITNPIDIIHYHFEDSLALSRFIDISKLTMIADVGSGAGFPGLPLKILFPHLNVVLIEVNNKKRSFLSHVCGLLELQSITLYEYDWRTFLRMTQYPIDLFCSRASLQPDELIRIFKPSCPYQESIVVYWASEQWVPKKQESPFIEKEISYTLDGRGRKFIFFNKKK